MGKEAPSSRRQWLGRLSAWLGGAVVFAAMGLVLFMVAYPKRIAAATSVSGIDVGLLSKGEAADRLEAWWERRSQEPLVLHGLTEGSEAVTTTPASLGIGLDVEGTLAQLPMDDFTSWISRTTGSEPQGPRHYEIHLDFTDLDEEALQKVVAETGPPLAPAQAYLDKNGEIVRVPEVSSMKLARSETEKALARAIPGDGVCRVAAAYGKKDVPDQELEKITDVVSTFSTNFSAGDRSRSQNLKVAAEKLDGVVLLPGEKFSFNEYVGERTAANGFLEAGVYRQGRHEIDFGGGVCQVSTTLFNAVVLANLDVKTRHNHTFTVPYVPIGRDAAVAFGWYDMAFVNSHKTPIAIDAKYERGKLTFSILGVKEAGLEVKIVPVVTQKIEHETVYIEDPKLPTGKIVEVEKGGNGYRAVTTKIVLRDGVEVSRATLCKSYYKGAPKIIAHGPKTDTKPKNDTTIPIVNPGA